LTGKLKGDPGSLLDEDKDEEDYLDFDGNLYHVITPTLLHTPKGYPHAMCLSYSKLQS
jgi:hypothetical protein